MPEQLEGRNILFFFLFWSRTVLDGVRTSYGRSRASGLVGSIRIGERN